MILLPPLVRIVRPGNCLMAGVTVGLGFWLGGSISPLQSLLFLCLAAGAATAFGNVINDLSDIDTDRLSHPDRPLPQKELSAGAVRCFAAVLAVIALSSGLSVSPLHLGGTILPLCLLTIYTRYLKPVPLAGNFAISLLVAYPLIFGALDSPAFSRLFVPALLAFIVNLMREVIKDLQDQAGDTLAGLKTTASLSSSVISLILYLSSICFLLMLPLPLFVSTGFSKIYGFIALGIVAPLHLFWTYKWWRRDIQNKKIGLEVAGEVEIEDERKLKFLSGMLKVELVFGLLAIAGDDSYKLLLNILVR